MYNILLCDDEEDILYALKIYLDNPDYIFYEAKNGEEAIEILKNNHIDLLLIDIMMPVKDGIAAVKELRQFSNIPVIFLTAKSESYDKVAGFDEGADDYITKPFDPADVKARVRAQLRRYTVLGSKPRDNKEDILEIGGILLNDSQKKVLVNGEEISLTFSEYEILKLLMSNQLQELQQSRQSKHDHYR